MTTPRTLVRALTGGVLAASLLAVTACGGGTPASSGGNAPVEITFSSYNYGTAGAAGKGTQDLLDAFAKAHPDIKVVPQAVPTAEILSRTKADVAAGNAPDVVQLGYSKLNEAQQTLPLQSLQQLAGDDWEPHTAGIAPGPLKAGEWDGQIRSVPYTVSIPAVFFNADLFKAAGLDPAAPPTTLAGITDAAARIKATGSDGVYFAAVDPGKSDYLSQSILNTAGAGILDDKGSVAIDSPASVNALSAIQKLTTDGLQPAVGPDDAQSAFSAGKLGMFIGTTAYAKILGDGAKGKFELRSTAFPAFGDRPAAPTHSGAGLVVLSKDPAKQCAAWTFLKFLTGKDGYTIITKELGYLPLRKDIVSDPAYLGDYFKTNTLLAPSLAQLDTVAPYRAFPGRKSNQATVLFQDTAVEPILLRGADPQRTLTETAGRIRSLG